MHQRISFLLAVVFAILPFLVTGQTRLFYDDFEGTLSMSSTGSPGWAVSTTLSAGGSKSDSTRFVNPGDSSFLTSPTLSTVGYSWVVLKFKHICKLEFFDGGFVQVSTDNGLTWTSLGNTHYRGQSFFGSTGERFNALSYPEWDLMNPGAVPSNSWWKSEVFNISLIASGISQLRVRFMAKDLNNNGSLGNYGWLIDDIEVWAGSHELIPPFITLFPGNPIDSVGGTGPYQVSALVEDSSGISSVYLHYSAGMVSDSVQMNPGANQMWSAFIPSFPYNTTICYYVVARDSSVYQNAARMPEPGCVSFFNYKVPAQIQVGTAGTSGYFSPIYNGNATGTDRYSQHISVFTPADLTIKGIIKKLAWNKADNSGYSGNDARMRIYLKHTLLDSISQLSGSFSTELQGAVLVYDDSTTSLVLNSGWQEFLFNKSFFTYNGSSNLMVLVDWYRPGNLSANFPTWYYSSSPNKAISFHGSTANPTSTGGAGQRPNTLFFIDQQAWDRDVAMASISQPVGNVVSSSQTPVKVFIKNIGVFPLSKATINWSVNGVVQTPYIWTGTLQTDMASNEQTLGQYLFPNGNNTIKIWVSMPNDSTDHNPYNDTLSISVFSCTQILGGVYTLGTPLSDFASFDDLMNSLSICGLNAPTVIRIMPGVYNTQLQFTDSIPGLSNINTLKFTSYALDLTTVTIKATPSSSSNFVLSLKGAKYLTFEHLTFKSEGASIGNVVVLTGMAMHNTIAHCVIEGSYGTNNDVNGVVISEKSSYNHIRSNRIINGYSSVRTLGNNSSRTIGNIIEDNDCRFWAKYGLYLNYDDSTLIRGNRIYSNFVSPSSSIYGIGTYNNRWLKILANKIHIHFAGPGYGIYYTSTSDSANIIANNFVSLTGNSTSQYNYGFYFNSSSGAHVYHNSIMNATGNSNASALTFEGNCFGFKLKNNIFAHMNGGLSLMVFSSAVNAISISDYNNFFTTGSTLAKWATSTLVPVSGGISGLTALSSSDQNSIITNPMFYDQTNLHSFSQVLNNAGSPLPSITTDIDGDPRHPLTPDIGADEYSLSTIDAGVLSIIQPLASDTQNRVVAVKAIIRNFGTAPLTSVPVSYRINGGSQQSAIWTGNLAYGQSDTITLPAMQIPALNYNLEVYSHLNGDTLNFNDTLKQSFYGMPLINASLHSALSPVSGCDLGIKPLTIRIKNAGLQSIGSGLTAAYQVMGSPVVVSQTVIQNVAAGDSLDFTFATPIDLNTLSDSVFVIRAWVSHAQDVYPLNDTLYYSILSLGPLDAPILSDTTVNFATSAVLHAVTNYPVDWFLDYNSQNPVFRGSHYTTPIITDTTIFYAQSNTTVPQQILQAGFNNLVNGQYQNPSPYSGAGKQQYLYLASELHAAGYTSGAIEALAFYSAQYFGSFSGMNISIGTTTNNSLTTTFLTTPVTMVFSGAIEPQVGWNYINFSTPFQWDGVSNILIHVVRTTNFLLAPAIQYSVTTFNSATFAIGVGGVNATTGQVTMNRPNIRFRTQEVLGCRSLKVPVKVNIIPLAKDVKISSIGSPQSGCGLSSAPVIIAIMNHGLDTIFGGINVSYRVNNGTFTTPETINATILPWDTLLHTFTTSAALPSGPSATKYRITAAVGMTGDMYLPNDTLIGDSITSHYTPAPLSPLVQAVPYGNSVTLSPASSDTLYWFDSPTGGNLLQTGSPFVSGPLYDTILYYVEARKTSGMVTTQIGTGSGSNNTYSLPTPYGGSSHGAKHQFLIRASELTALGWTNNEIRSIGFNVADPNNVVMENYSIKIGHTQQTDLSYFETNLTTVFAAPFYTPTFNINTHVFSLPFTWDGVSNLVVETCFKNPSSANIASVYQSATSFASCLLTGGSSTFDCSNVQVASAPQLRPNIYFGSAMVGYCSTERVVWKMNTTGIPAVDVSVKKIVTPLYQADNGVSTPVKVVLRNYGTQALTSATIHFKIDNQTPATYSWTGNLNRLEEDTVVLGNVIFTGGLQKLLVWSSKTGDNFATNDTAKTTLKVCMSGSYTVGSGKTFASPALAFEILSQTGICGNVELIVDSGQYIEKFVITSIQGSGPNAWITLRGAGSDSTHVRISEGTTAASPHIIRLQGASFIRFKHLTISANGSANGYAIQLNGNCTNIEVLNCLINSVVSSTMGNSAGIYSLGTTLNSLLVKNSVIRYGYSGIHLSGSSSQRQKNLRIEGCQIFGFYSVGIYAYYQDSMIVKGNRIVSDPSNQYYFGIRSYYGTGLMEIGNNRFLLYPTNYAYGLDIQGYVGTTQAYGMIYNNMISILSGTGTNAGLYLATTQNLRIAFNSVLLGGVSTTNRGIFMGNGSNNEFLNNNISVISGQAFYTTVPGSISVMNHNNYHVGPLSSGFVHWGGPIASLAAFKAFDTGKNVQSISVDPVFTSASDLHAGNVLLNAASTPVAGITTDFDGDLRDTQTPDIGADEFFPAAIDVMAGAVIKPSGPGCGFSTSDSIAVRVFNFGTSTINFATHPLTVKAAISGLLVDTITTFVNSGTLASAQAIDVVVSTGYNFAAPGEYIIKGIALISADTVIQNNISPEKRIISRPTISTFPFTDDFESGKNITFNEFTGIDAGLKVSPVAAASGQYGLHFDGGGYTLSYNAATTVDLAYANTAKIARAFTCDVIPPQLPFLRMKFDLKQTHNTSGNPNTSWFRVMLMNYNGTFYLKNTQGDSTFRSVSANSDPFTTHVFDLNEYVSQPFTLRLEAVCRLAYGTGSFSGDNAFVDNFSIWVPNATDLALTSIVQPQLPFRRAGDMQTVRVAVANFGTDTITSLPLTYQIGTLPAVSQTFILNLLPTQTDTLSFATPFAVPPGNNALTVFSSVSGDSIHSNDTIIKSIKGMETIQPSFTDGFELTDRWARTGSHNQWELGAPQMNVINTAHSGTNVWATRLSSNYITAAQEHLYSPYFVIPQTVDTAVLSFWQWMKVFPQKAYGALQYSVNDGASWASIGYISSPEATNWYNSNINGFHCWSSTNSNWINSTIKLDPVVFNTGNPVQFRFTFIAESYQFSDEGWAIDDFSIIMPQMMDDAGILSIDTPHTQVVTGQVVYPKVVIKNYGLNALTTIPLSYRLNSLAPISEIWTGNLQPDSSVVFAFTTPFTSPSGTYSFCAYTHLAVDPLASNDTACTNVNALPGAIDAGVIAVEAPVLHSTTGSATTVSVSIKNYGTDTLYSIPVSYSINTNVMSTETFSGILLPDSITSFTFLSTYISPAGIYQLCAKTVILGDVDNDNDSLCIIITGTGIENLAQQVELHQNFPNPADYESFIKIKIPVSGQAKLSVYNSLGELVLSEELGLNAGENLLRLNTSGWNQGIYIYSMDYANGRVSRRMLINR